MSTKIVRSEANGLILDIKINVKDGDCLGYKIVDAPNGKDWYQLEEIKEQMIEDTCTKIYNEGMAL